ncbi:MAG: DUF58 domain-containing protein [Vulcanimicrobiaceae bacterium]
MTLREALLRGRRRPRAFGSGSPTVYRGDGYEFVELRGYVPGDDVRRIDWAATARAGALQTRVVLEDVALTLAAIVDDSGSMRVGRHRPLLDAAYDALRAWLDVALADDRAIRIGPNVLAPARGERGKRAARIAGLPLAVPFDLRAALETARAALPRGSALLVVSDWHDIERADIVRVLAELGTRFDCTALVARDPWFDGLPLRGFATLRGAEGGRTQLFIGRREREQYAGAVREREEHIVGYLDNANWRVAILHESDGAGALADAFALAHERPARVRARFG